MGDYREMIRRQLNRSYDRLQAALKGVRPEEAAQRPHGLAPIVWQIGHLVIYDGQIVRAVGRNLPVPEGYDALFNKGTDGSGPFPPLDAVAAEFSKIHRELLDLTNDDLERPIDAGDRYQSLLEGLIYTHAHRQYHIGKIMTLRALLGKPIIA